MKTLLKKFAILKTISSKIDTCLHKINVNLQEDSSDFDDEEWMDYPTRPTLPHIVLDLLLSPKCGSTEMKTYSLSVQGVTSA